MAKKGQTKLTKWAKSNAKALLRQDLRQGDIPLETKEMPPQDVYIQRTEFTKYPYNNFRANLQNLRIDIVEDDRRAAEEAAILARDMQIRPLAMANPRGYPRWKGSTAEKLLKKDIDDGKHKMFRPQELRSQRDEYQQFPKDVFCKHIHQEVSAVPRRSSGPRRWRHFSARRIRSI